MASVGDATNRAAAFVGKMSMKGIDTDLKFEAKQSGSSTHVYVKTGASWLDIAARLGSKSAIEKRDSMRSEAFKQIKQDFTKTYGAEITNKIFPSGEGAKSISVGQLKGFYDLAERMKQNDGTTSGTLTGNLSGPINVPERFEQLKSEGTGSGTPVGTIREKALEFAKTSGGDPVGVFKEVGGFMNAKQRILEGPASIAKQRDEITKLGKELANVASGSGPHKNLSAEDKTKQIQSLTQKIADANQNLKKLETSLEDASKLIADTLTKYPDGSMRALLDAAGRGPGAVFDDNHFKDKGLFDKPTGDIFKKNLEKLDGDQFAALKKNDLKSFAIMLVQYPPRLELLSRELMKGLDPAPTTEEGWSKAQSHLGKLATEILSNYNTQIESYRIFSEAVRDPRLTEGMSDAQKKNLQQLGDAAANMVRAMSNPEGPIQGLISLATIAGTDPKQAVEMLRAGKQSGSESIAFADKMTQVLGSSSGKPTVVKDPAADFGPLDLSKPGAPEAFLKAFHIKTTGPDGEPLPPDQMMRKAVDTMNSRTLLGRVDNDWQRAKKELTNEQMSRLTQFRKDVVDGLIDELRADGTLQFAASSVGSTAITSDYDITFGSNGSMDDVRAMGLFNENIKALFGGQPGTVFDTNIYVQDYVTVKEKINKTDHDEESLLYNPKNVFDAGIEIDQHVMGLLKMRRTMSNTEWNTMEKGAIGTQTTDPKVIESHYSQADTLYALSNNRLFEQLVKLGAPNDLSEADVSPDDLAMVQNEKNQVVKDLMIRQLGLAGYIARIQKQTPDLVLQARNEIYGEIATEVRKLDAEIRTGVDRDGNALTDDQIVERHASKVELTGLSIFFAAEAYHSAGAVRHVVAGLQGGVGTKLSVADLHQSVIEQLGDARMHAHANNDPDLVVGSAKYLTRVLDVLNRLQTNGYDQTGMSRQQIQEMTDIAGEAMVRLIGRGNQGQFSAADMGLFIKHTILACKKGEIEVSPSEATRLKQFLDGGVPFFKGLADLDIGPLLRQAADNPGTKVTVPKEIRDTAPVFAEIVFKLDPGGHVFEDRIKDTVAYLDGALSTYMKTMTEDEITRHYQNLGSTPDVLVA